MSSYNRRKFVKLSTLAAAGSAVILPGLSYGCAADEPEIRVWDVPGGEFLRSPDYEVTLRKNGETWKPFTYFSYRKGVDKIIDHEGEGKYIKLGVRRLQSDEYKLPEESTDTFAHSWTNFDFSNGPVEVEVKLLRPFNGLTLPMKSCEVYPSSLGIKCELKDENIISFVLDKPAKIAIVANSQLAIEKLGEMPSKQALEGYRNPLFLFARNPETNVPSKDAEGTLVVKPGENYGPAEFKKAKTIYFEPGIHDFSKYNDEEDPNHYIYLSKGQTVYLPGGAYLYGIFNSDVEKPIADMALVRGRGVMSGDKQLWTGSGVFYNLVKRVCIDGIHITEPHNHVTHGLGYFKDVAVVGAWHGNTDGIGRNVPVDDPYEGWHADECFCMAGDTNLALGGFGRVRNHTMWQLANAEPVWIQGVKDCVADGIFIIAYNRYSAQGQAFNVLRNASRPELRGGKIRVRNVVIDAPFMPRIISVTTGLQIDEVVFEDVIFENFTVNTPYILNKSLVGSTVDNATNYGKVVFRNVVIQGTKVTAENYMNYFEVLKGVIVGKELIFE
jgi:hypothetical protein